MSEEKVKFKPLEDINIWDDFVDNSPEGTIFHQKKYLDSVSNINYRIFQIEYKSDFKAGLILLFDKSNKDNIINHLEVIYSGILFKKNKDLRLTKYNYEKFIILESTAKYLEENFNQVSINLSPNIKDIRPFLWNNYNNSKRKYQVNQRYTSYINLDESLLNNGLENSLFSNLEPVRRYSIRQALKKNLTFEYSPNIEEAIFFYKEMMSSYEDDESLQKKIKSIINTLKIQRLNGSLRSLKTLDKNNNPSYYVFYLNDKKRSYYLYGIKTPYTCQYSGTYANWVIWKKIFSDDKLNQIDLEGVNSPSRGWFKLSFGGSLERYYEVILD